MEDIATLSLKALWKEGVRAIVFFDGTCGLCDRFVQFSVARDWRRRLRYAPQQGETFRRIFGEPTLNSVVTITLNRDGLAAVHRRSDAMIEAVRLLGLPWRGCVLLRLIPRLIRDTLYRIVSVFRYHIFGKYTTCRIPASGEARLFLP